MELNVTDFITRHQQMENFVAFASSRAETGENAGAINWRNAQTRALEAPFGPLTDAQITALKEYFRSFGAWEDDDIDSWGYSETVGLAVQLVAGDYRENYEGNSAELTPAEREKLQSEGVLSSNLISPEQTDDGQWYYYFGS